MSQYNLPSVYHGHKINLRALFLAGKQLHEAVPVQAVLQKSDHFSLHSNTKCAVSIGREISFLYSIGFLQDIQGRETKCGCGWHVSSVNATRQHSAPTGQQQNTRCCAVVPYSDTAENLRQNIVATISQIGAKP